jgi:YVTN family beta-propeller protein
MLYLSSRVTLWSLFLCVCAGSIAGDAATPTRELPGQKPDGSVLLPNQWSLRPAGKQVELGDFPVNTAMHPKGKFVAVLHCGQSKHEIIIVDVGSAKVESRTALDEAFYGLAFSETGEQLYCSGASAETIRVFDFKNGKLTESEGIALREAKVKGIPAGLAVSKDGKRLYVANLWAHSISEIDLEQKKKMFELRLTGSAPTIITPTGDANDPDIQAVIKRDQANHVSLSANEPFPYACVLDEKNERLYVSLWNLATVAVIDLKNHAVLARIPTQEHPNEMLLTKDGKTLYVANANRNTVSVIDTDSAQARETLYASLYSNLPPGATPCSLALTPDEKTLFISNATINAIAVFDVSETGKSKPLGFIPAGWYPTSVRVTPDGKRLLIANGKGGSSKANPNGPKPGVKAKSKVEYIAALMTGTLSIIELPKREKFEEQLKEYTAQVYQSSPIRGDLSATGVRPADNPVPLKVGDPSPIRYCIYVIKENRTYDQILGDMKEGNGDPELCLFPEKVTPNHHKLAKDFVLLDNFYVDAEVSADGHEWTMGAYATDFVEKSWPLSYGHNKSGKYTYPSEGKLKIAIPAGGYLWDRAKEAGVSYHSFGEFVLNGKTPNDPCTTRLESLQGHFDPKFRSFDMDYSDLKRVDRYVEVLKGWEQAGEMPRLQIVRLPNDHTNGTVVGKMTPTAFMAENDLALGRMVEALSKSKFWPQTAIFVLEDDAQNGADHVDAHRSIAYVISPYTKRNSIDSTMYSTSSMLRTMELILGLQPMSHYDAAATPMFGCFTAKADTRPYEALPASVDLNEKNQKTAWGADLSNEMNFASEDAADDLLLNEVVWRSVKGPHSKMPAPTRAAFVFVHSKDDDDDD